MPDRPEAVLDLPAAGTRGVPCEAPPCTQQYDRVAAALKALGRPFPRALALAAGPDLASHVLQEVPGLRLVALEFATMPNAGARRFGPKAGRRTPVTRHVSDPDWHAGLGRFDAVITVGVPPVAAARHRPAALFAQIRQLVLPGGALLLSTEDDGPPRHTPSATLDDHRRVLAEAGWSSIDRLRPAPGHLLLKANP